MVTTSTNTSLNHNISSYVLATPTFWERMVYQRYTRITVLIESLYPPLTQLYIHYPPFYKILFLLVLKRTTAVLQIALNCITYFRKNRYEILTYFDFFGRDISLYECTFRSCFWQYQQKMVLYSEQHENLKERFFTSHQIYFYVYILYF